MATAVETIDNLDQEQTARLVMDIMHRTIIHYALWFTEIRHQMGMEKALEALSAASEKSLGIQFKRLSKILGFDMQNGIPAPLLNMGKKDLLALLDGAAINWLANDGVWFQAVEFANGMNDAKRCNDTCWSRYSPYEAVRIKELLDLPANGGLAALKTALAFRMYALINDQSIEQVDDRTLIFYMNNCRVQAARKRKGLPDYPCKSAGLVEYPCFAGTIDPRIKTECVGCPPDEHPDGWFCAWKFTLGEE